MDTKKIKIVIMAIFIVAATNTWAQRQFNNQNQNCPQYSQNQNYNKQNNGNNKYNNNQRYYQNLELTDEQTNTINNLRLAHQKEMLPLRNNLNEKKARLNTLETAYPADIKAINQVIDEINNIKTNMAKLKAAHKQEIRKVLTDEQRLNHDSNKNMYRGKHGNSKGKKCNYNY